jgi:hypothetical protein
MEGRKQCGQIGRNFAFGANFFGIESNYFVEKLPNDWGAILAYIEKFAKNHRLKN